MGVAASSDNETRSESQEQEQQNVRMHTPPLTYDIPSLPQKVEVTLSGTGCAILQVYSICPIVWTELNFIILLIRPKFIGKRWNHRQ